MTRSTPSRALALVLFGAAISSGVLAAPTPSPMNSGSLSTGAQGAHHRSSLLDQKSLSVLERREVEHVNLVPRTGHGGAELTEDNLTVSQQEEIRQLATEFHKQMTQMTQALTQQTTKFLEELKSAESKLQKIKEERQSQPQADPQFFHDHESDILFILFNAETIAATPLSSNVVDRAVENHRQCLQFQFVPEAVKEAAAKRLSESLGQRKHLLDQAERRGVLL
ncbi:hypothetical protein C8R42DRAFT_722577 [Lentinula raphanica]|nr:hypothetical protein C8R42DRAFT_722577 [Lentinula raphanica]